MIKFGLFPEFGFKVMKKNNWSAFPLCFFNRKYANILYFVLNIWDIAAQTGSTKFRKESISLHFSDFFRIFVRQKTTQECKWQKQEKDSA